MLLGKREPTANANIDKSTDGKVTIIDVVLLKQIAAGVLEIPTMP